MPDSRAKTSRPRLPELFRWDRLFHQLDVARERPIVWVSAPAGSGKTTLVASWLAERSIPSLWYRLDRNDGDPATFFHYLSEAAHLAAPRTRKPLLHPAPEARLDLPTFAGDFFANLFARLPKASVAVFDDYHEVPPDSPLPALLWQMLDAIPPGISVVIISRSAPPPALTRFAAAGKLVSLGLRDPILTTFSSSDDADIQRRAAVLLGKTGQFEDAAILYGQAEERPWPLKIYTFGRFSLVRDGAPVTFAGKVQQKPLEMLKALIALGGRNISEKQLSDFLWSNADWEEAHRSFTVTLHRLRRLLGNEKFIELNEGRVTLNSRKCWVDVWAFERLAGEVENLMKQDSPGKGAAKPLAPAHKAISLYRGDFLAGEADRPWSLARRARLRSRMLRLAGMVGREHEEQGAWDQAVECYLRGLDANELAEELYQRLMHCYHQLGRHGEIASIYQRCRMALALQGIKPSPRTEAIFEKTALEN